MITQPFKLITLCVAVVLLGACSSSGGSLPDPTALKSIVSQLDLHKHWSVSVGKGDRQSSGVLEPALDEHQVVAVAGTTLVSYDLTTGNVLWKADLGDTASAGVEMAASQLFVATQSGKLMAFNKQDGAGTWQVNTSSEALASPRSNGSIVVVQTIDGKVSAYRAEDGQFLWSYAANMPSLTVRGTSTPVITNNYTYAGFASGKLVALDNATGQLVWQQVIGSAVGRSEIERLVDIDGAIILSDGTLYVTSYQGNLAAVDALTGSIKWQEPVSSLSGAQLMDDVILVVDAQDRVLAYDRKQGHVLWQNDALKHRLLSSPMNLSGYGLVVDAQGYAHLLQLSDGALVGREKIGSKGPRIGAKRAQNNVYLLSQDGRLTRLGLN